MKDCPYCEGKIPNNAKKCKYCWEIVVEEKVGRQCPYCEAELSETAMKCKHCWEWVEEKNLNKENGNRIINSQDSENWFSWRINRKSFFLVYLIIAIIQWVILLVVNESGPDNPSRFVVFLTLGWFLFIAPFPRRIKRFHDIWQSWWYCLLYILVWIYRIFDIYLIFAPWQKWKNKYGDEPSF